LHDLFIFKECPSVFKIRLADGDVLEQKNYDFDVVRLSLPNHCQIKGNQVRGIQRVMLQKECLLKEPHEVYNDLILKHKEEVLMHGNASNIPAKGILRFIYCG